MFLVESLFRKAFLLFFVFLAAKSAEVKKKLNSERGEMRNSLTNDKAFGMRNQSAHLTFSPVFI